MFMLAKSINVLFAVIMFSLSVGACFSGIWLSGGRMSLYMSWEFIFWGNSLDFVVIFDAYSAFFIATVSVIAMSVYLFSWGYMAAEKFFVRFQLLVLLFLISMLLLILSPSPPSLLLGWDGLGMSSYLLVIYFQNAKSHSAGLLTVLTNRLGDVALLLALSCFYVAQGWGFPTLHLQTPDGLSAELTWGWYLVAAAACTKSAQIPFSAWLPAAMAAPTPVSALVHSSTLVTAGIWMLARLTPAGYHTYASEALMYLGLATMTMAGFTAMIETDMKKLVALSTLSQLGLMMAIVGIGCFDAAFLHMLSHAFFKALLFMTVGAMIHMSNDYQDLRKISLLAPRCSLTLSLSLVATMSLCGLPFTSGFFTKDLCFEVFQGSAYATWLTQAIFTLGVALTAAYSARFIALAVTPTTKSPALKWTHEQNWGMNLGMLLLAPLAIGGGSGLLWVIPATPPLNPLFWASKIFLFSFILAAAILGWATRSHTSLSYPPLVWVLGLMWGLPRLSARPGAVAFLWLSSYLRSADLSWIRLTAMSPALSLRSGAKVMNQANLKTPWMLRGGLLLLILLSSLLYLCAPNFFSF